MTNTLLLIAIFLIVPNLLLAMLSLKALNETRAIRYDITQFRQQLIRLASNSSRRRM